MRAACLLLVLPLLAGATSAQAPPRPEVSAKKFRLLLHAPEHGGIYFSAWNGSPVITDHDGSDGKTVTYSRRYVWSDGCTWEANETLVPSAPDRYEYKYREHPLSCPKGATAETFATTPRDGNVTVELIDSTEPNTPLTAWMRT